MYPPIFERQSGACDEVTNRLRHENLAGGREARHTSTNVNGNASKIIADQLTLASMNTAAHLEVKGAHRIIERTRTADRPCRSFKRGKKAVSRSADFASSMDLQYFSS